MKTNHPKSPREAKRTVLMVDEHGQIRTIRKFHQKLRIFVALGLGVLLVAAAAVWLYVDGLQTQRELQQRITSLQARVATAEHQQELLLARAVKAETRGRGAQRVPPAAVKTAPPAAAPTEDVSRPPVPADDSASAATAIKAATTPTSSGGAGKAKQVVSVSVEDLEVDYKPSEKAIATEFIIRNTGNIQAQGRAVIVLSTVAGGTAPRLSLPRVPLDNGRPQGSHGSRFVIKHFMRLKIQRKMAEPGLTFDTADVFIFDMQGKLLQEKTFAVALRIPAPKPATAAAVSVDEPEGPEATGAPASNSILAIPSGSRQEFQGGQEN